VTGKVRRSRGGVVTPTAGAEGQTLGRRRRRKTDAAPRAPDLHTTIGKLRSFAEARASNHELIREGLTYGDARTLLDFFRFCTSVVGPLPHIPCDLVSCRARARWIYREHG